MAEKTLRPLLEEQAELDRNRRPPLPDYEIAVNADTLEIISAQGHLPPAARWRLYSVLAGQDGMGGAQLWRLVFRSVQMQSAILMDWLGNGLATEHYATIVMSTRGDLIRAPELPPGPWQLTKISRPDADSYTLTFERPKEWWSLRLREDAKRRGKTEKDPSEEPAATGTQLDRIEAKLDRLLGTLTEKS